jgi:hypothetical protein
MVGGPGSGKTSARVSVIGNLKENIHKFVLIDPDIILTKFFNNNSRCRDKVDNSLYEIAYSEGYNLIFDETGKDFYYYKKDAIERLKDAGYKTHLCIVVLSNIYFKITISNVMEIKK